MSRSPKRVSEPRCESKDSTVQYVTDFDREPATQPIPPTTMAKLMAQPVRS